MARTDNGTNSNHPANFSGNESVPPLLGIDYQLYFSIIQIINIAMMVPSIAFFVCITAIIFGEASLRENSRYVLFSNLLTCDTCFLTSSVIITSLIWQHQRYGLAACYTYVIISSTLNHCGVLCVTLMSFERYVAVCHPLHHAAWFNRRATALSLAAIWALASVCQVVRGGVVLAGTAAGAAEPPLNVTSSCSTYVIDAAMPNADVLVTLRELPNAVFFTACAVTQTFAYVRIVAAARRAAATASDRASNARRATNTVALHAVQLFLYLCALSNTLLLMLFTLVTSDARVIGVLRINAYLVIFFGSRFVAPLVYGLRDKELRRHFRKRVACRYFAASTGKVDAASN
uniref:Odorant receptor 131-2-like n=1 Tax=Petromyzon marinus TaxID=7757 RepID=A0AAJ7UDA6_PETMA|nr:odorant receptor 131-2-like [Petromyzon marinus]